MKFSGLCFFLLLFGLTPVYLQAADRALYDDAVLAVAEQRIGNMDEHELDEFRTYLASCGTSTGVELRRYYCEFNTRKYLLRYGRDGAIEALMQSLSVVGLMIDALDSPTTINQGQKNIMLQDIARYNHIRGVIKSAVRRGFLRLREKTNHINN